MLGLMRKADRREEMRRLRARRERECRVECGLSSKMGMPLRAQ